MFNLKFLVFHLAFTTSCAASAGCLFKEAEKMVKEGTSRSVIKDKCDDEIEDMPRCTLTKVVGYLQAKKSRSTIADECASCERPQCDLPNGAYCTLPAKVPKGIRQGDICTCFTAFGPVRGEFRCEL